LREALDEWLEAIEHPDDSRFSQLMTTCRSTLDDAQRNGV
jgi:hypothetical protein